MDEKIVIKKNGKEVECDVLFTFHCEDNGKEYIGYTDHSTTPDGRKNIYTASYDPILGTGSLEKIETEEEKEMIQEVLMQINDEARSD